MGDESGFRFTPLSFVRRGGRMSEGQERAWSDLSPRYLFDVPRDVGRTSVDTRARFTPAAQFGREAPLIVEVGSGQGHAIVAAAVQHPDRDFVAVEVYRSGLARTMLDADREGVRNLRLIEANAPEVLRTLLPEASVQELWIFFPDPWHKKRHNKRRLIAPEFVPEITRVLADGGLVRLATDWQDYADQMRDVLDDADDLTRSFAGEWAQRFDGRVMTAFERKGTAKGRDIRDLTYLRSPRTG